jgi:hypothetical protein
LISHFSWPFMTAVVVIVDALMREGGRGRAEHFV